MVRIGETNQMDSGLEKQCNRFVMHFIVKLAQICTKLGAKPEVEKLHDYLLKDEFPAIEAWKKLDRDLAGTAFLIFALYNF